MYLFLSFFLSFTSARFIVYLLLLNWVLIFQAAFWIHGLVFLFYIYLLGSRDVFFAFFPVVRLELFLIFYLFNCFVILV